MNDSERNVLLTKELLEGIDKGDFDNIETIPEKYTYGHLRALYVMINALDDGRILYERIYKQIYTLATTYGKNHIRKKEENGEKIRIAFLAISAAEWPARDLYQMFAKNEKVECYVIVVPLIDRDSESRRDTYRQTYQFFLQNGYQVMGAYDEDNGNIATWNDLGGMPDIMIHLTPWYESLPADFQVTSFSFRCINCHIPYGIYVENSLDGLYALNFAYNKDFFNLMWKMYIDSAKNLEGHREYGLLHGENVVFSGYAKMDRFYNTKERCEEEVQAIWKIPAGKRSDEVKKVIIAPHHSFLGYGGIKYATFAKNAHFLLYLAEKYKDRVTFIFKPHPNLRLRAVEAGVFESYGDYDAYLEKWNTLPNAKVVQEADYLDIFLTSDGMIMDSISFIAEYMYVDKPLLFLRGKGQAFNKLGKEIICTHYSAWGEDYAGIEGFLQDVIINEKDINRSARENVWKNELDYMSANNCSASEFIYQDICSLFSDKEKSGKERDI